jgi:hypothetical protein
MRYETTTLLRPEEVATRARRFFGRNLGLEERHFDHTMTFTGGGGGVALETTAGEDCTTVELLAREWDIQAREFLREVHDDCD